MLVNVSASITIILGVSELLETNNALQILQRKYGCMN